MCLSLAENGCQRMGSICRWDVDLRVIGFENVGIFQKDMNREKITKQLDWVRDRFGSIEKYIQIHYGKQAPFSILGDVCLVHLDDPDEETIKEREREFLKDDGLDDDCPLCQLQREEGGFVVYDGCDGWCAECKQRETCESYDPEEWKEGKIEETDSKVRVRSETEGLARGPWSTSYVNTDNLDKMSLDLAVHTLSFGVLAHAVELKMDLKEHEDAQDTIRSFLDPIESACRDLKLFLATESRSFVPSEISVNLQVAISALSKLASSELREKADDLIVKLEKLLNLTEGFENQPSF